ncbi:MAG: hypothetical protein KGL53_14985, partial [Elusimicrobia bacterium]|nr:hypothetical protein [Elusimicrobiota bacterium]
MRKALAREWRWLAASAALTLVFFSAAVLALGQNPFALLGVLVQGAFLNPYGFGQIVYKSTTLVFTGLGCAL